MSSDDRALWAASNARSCDSLAALSRTDYGDFR